MKVTPMIFNTEMVKALLDGRKAVTRRPVSKVRAGTIDCRTFNKTIVSGSQRFAVNQQNPNQEWLAYPFVVGDLIWVRETFCTDPDCDHDSWDDHELSFFEWNNCGCSAALLPDALKTHEHCLFRAGGLPDLKWTPSIHMPRWASRLTLRVTDVRIERVQELTEEQAKLEGIRYHSLYQEWGGVESHPDSRPHAPQWRWYEKANDAFKYLWNSIYQNWDENPYVWVIEFEVIHQNVDKVVSELGDVCQ